jgi:hypothetical protein
MRQPDRYPSVVRVTYFIVVGFTLLIAIAGYLMFGDLTQEEVMGIFFSAEACLTQLLDYEEFGDDIRKQGFQYAYNLVDYLESTLQVSIVHESAVSKYQTIPVSRIRFEVWRDCLPYLSTYCHLNLLFGNHRCVCDFLPWF